MRSSERKQLAEAPRVAEDDVAQDQQAPPVANHLERQVDRTAGPMTLSHSAALAQNRLTHYTACVTRLVAKCNH